MCKLLEDMRNEAAIEAAKKTAVHLIKLDRMTLQKIAEATEVPIDAVRGLETETMQSA